jgi:integrase
MRQYIELRVALGRGFKEPSAILKSFDLFLSRCPKQRQGLTANTFEAWCETQAGVTDRVRRYRMFVIRNFCLYRRRTVPDCFVPDASLFPAARKYRTVAPYNFSDAEVAKLMNAALRLTRSVHSPLRPEVIRLAIMLLYTSGLRHGEVLTLTISDFDVREKALLIRASKFRKTRIVPISFEVTREIERYLQLRRHNKLPVYPTTPLITHEGPEGKGYSGAGFWQNFRVLVKACDIRTASGGLPRIHDLRHSFAVNVLVRWYQAKADVQAKLPLLAAYLGHVSIASTYYYLRFIEPLRNLANQRFNDTFGGLVEPVSVAQGGQR